MSKKATKRAAIVAKLAGHFLASGLEDTSLRRLADVAGTSDRMLLYYFENKDDLVVSVLTHIGDDLALVLEAKFADEPKPPAEVMRALWELVKSVALADQLRLWLDLSSRASRQDPLYMVISEAMGEAWIKRLSALLDVPDAEKRAMAILIMATVDGQMFLFPTAPERGEIAIAKAIELLDRV
ncbi:MAG: TetR/AcrR family transcriptional regulator [Parvibaculum sp.]